MFYLTWRNLTHDTRRLGVAICAIGFAVVLMFLQAGFRNALLDSTVQVLEHMDADLVVISRAQFTLSSSHGFPLERLMQARGVQGVRQAAPLYMENFRGQLRSPGRKAYPIRVLAYHLEDRLLQFPSVEITTTLLSAPQTALLDERSKLARYGLTVADGKVSPEELTLSGSPLQVVGAFTLGSDFANDGNLLMSAPNFASYFPNRNPNGGTLSLVDLGLIRLEAGANADEVKHRLNEALVGVRILKRTEMIEQELNFWQRSVPIGYIFGVGTVMGFIVGTIICYQVIYAGIAKHMAEFATLKAIGYSSSFFVGVVLNTSVYLSIFGFIPGAVISWLIFLNLQSVTGLPMILTPWRIASVFLLALFMCSLSGALSLRKLLAADPADLFR